ncbi:hypothetical protein RHGRI_017190 [Rhododendron griersonianum]|uniref:5'-3' exonuclease domain-containing protein n=1 Tax=Rhododendron griersonianum TaxID=479676 RepID=A0AAV6JWV6_9ERIC|nr:hypothetical protein RHGRI_017190 [Rhododendron griersonianum]
MFEAAVVSAHVGITTPTTAPCLATLGINQRTKPKALKLWKLRAPAADLSGALTQTVGGQLMQQNNNNFESYSEVNESEVIEKKRRRRRRVFFLDVNPLCYKGSTPSLLSFAHWISLFFSQVSLADPVIAVIDGERGNEYRRQLLPSYKSKRRNFSKGPVWRSHRAVIDVLQKLNVPIVKIEGHEADDVVATLVDEVLRRGYRVVIASPDKDFKQLISEDVQIVMPMHKSDNWSFYTIKHYKAQYHCDPSSDLSLRSIVGDEVDGVPGIQHLVPSFGRKTTLKLFRKHGSLENLLNAAAVRTVGKPYVQDTLTKHADYLRRNYEVLSLRRDVDVRLQEDWLSERETCNDSVILTEFSKLLDETQKRNQ